MTSVISWTPVNERICVVRMKTEIAQREEDKVKLGHSELIKCGESCFVENLQIILHGLFYNA